MLEVLDLISGCKDPALGNILQTVKRFITLIQIIVPILLIAMTIFNIVKLVNNPDEKKLPKKIINSIIATVLVFILPIFVNVVMALLGETYTVSDCWNQLDARDQKSHYQDPYQYTRKNIYENSEYEKGKKKENTNSNNNTNNNANNNTSTNNNSQKIEGSAQKIGDVVWDSSDVTKISNLNSTQLIGILNAFGGNAKNFIPYAQELITAEHKYNVNVFFLLGIEALESGWITSPISRSCNNLGGVCATSNRPSNGCGSNYNCSFAHFNSVNDFIDYHADMLHNNYLTPGGDYYHGTSPSAVVTNYCPGCSDWPTTVTGIADGLFQKASAVV